MAFKNEFADYRGLKKIFTSGNYKNLPETIKIKEGISKPEAESYIRSKNRSGIKKIPQKIISIDGSFKSVSIKNGFPNAELGFIQTGYTEIDFKKLFAISKSRFISLKEHRSAYQTTHTSFTIPGVNIVSKKKGNCPKTYMREMLFKQLGDSTIAEGGETLLESYEQLLQIKLNSESYFNNQPKSPIEGQEAKDLKISLGKYSCNETGKILFSTDAMRFHEIFDPLEKNDKLFRQLMLLLEKLTLINLLRAFEARKELDKISECVFFIDGPLSCFENISWLKTSIFNEIKRINRVQKEISGKDLLIIGVEKTGIFCNYLNKIDKYLKFPSDTFPKESAFLVTDEFIKKNIKFSLSKKPYGFSTYFGRKIFYKTRKGSKIVLNVAFVGERQNFNSLDLIYFPRLDDIMEIIDLVESGLYKNSIFPLVKVNQEVSIPSKMLDITFRNQLKKKQY